jgi:GIY-YIG catalytic domain
LKLIKSLSQISSLPRVWVERLKEAKGIYLLTCPRTKEQYVGSACGNEGFYERWLQHLSVGGDAVGFKSREASDYQVSILEVAGSGASDNDILVAEQLWINKLQSRAMGLNN